MVKFNIIIIAKYIKTVNFKKNFKDNIPMIRDNYLDISKLTTDPKVMKLFQVVADNGGVLRFVGGAVRDALKGLSSTDLNLATDLSPDELVEACSDRGIKTIPLGIKQGTIGVVIGDTTLEVSSLYKYAINKDGVPEIEFTDNWEEDASRRDLTINAVYADENGNVFDYYNGIEDLEKGYVRFIDSATQRIKEDYLRILRYFRFYSLFGVAEPNQKALAACRENSAGLKKVAMERIRDELFKLIQTPNAPKAYRLMQENGILGYIMPDAAYIDDLEFLNQIIGEQNIDDAALVKMFVLYRPDPALAENLAVRLKFSRREKQLFMALATENISLAGLLNRKTLLKVIYRHDCGFARAKLLSAVASSRQVPDNLWTIYNEIAALPQFVFPVKGKDILDAGLNDRHQVGRVLKELEQIWIDSDFDLTKEQLLVQVDNLKEVI